MKGTNVAVRLPAGFAGLDPPAAWPRLPGTPRPERLDASVETLSGVGPALRRRLETDRTVTSSTASSSPKRSQTRLVGAGSS